MRDSPPSRLQPDLPHADFETNIPEYDVHHLSSAAGQYDEEMDAEQEGESVRDSSGKGKMRAF